MYDSEFWRLRKLAVNQLIKWQHRPRSEILEDMDFLESLCNASDRVRTKILKHMQGRAEFWPTDGY